MKKNFSIFAFVVLFAAMPCALRAEEEVVPSAQAIVVNASTGGIVLNQQFTNSLNEQIPNTGVYVLHIETEGGALVGQFIVQ